MTSLSQLLSRSWLIEELCTILKTEYIITESDTLESFLGINMIRQDGNLYLSQPGLIAKMVVKAGLPEKIRYFGTSVTLSKMTHPHVVRRTIALC